MPSINSEESREIIKLLRSDKRNNEEKGGIIIVAFFPSIESKGKFYLIWFFLQNSINKIEEFNYACCLMNIFHHKKGFDYCLYFKNLNDMASGLSQCINGKVGHGS